MSWILTGILFTLMCCIAHHANQLEAERDAVCDCVDEHLETIQVQRADLEARQLAIEGLVQHANLITDALVHALDGHPEWAIALVREHT